MADLPGEWSLSDVQHSVYSAPEGLPLLPPPPPPPVPGSPPPFEPLAPGRGATSSGDFSASTAVRASNGRGRVAVVVVGVIVLVSAVASGTLLLSKSGSSPAVIQSPTVANSKLYAAALASGSFHYVSIASGRVGGQPITTTQSGDTGRGQGVQYMTSAIGNYEVIVIGSMAYMKPDLKMLENTFGYSPSVAAPYVNQWIAFTPSDSPYRAVAADVTTETTWNDPALSTTDKLPQTPVSVSGISTLDGQSVQTVQYSLHGISSAANASYTGTETISFAATEPHLPHVITEQLSGTTSQGPSTERAQVTFTQWGEPVNVNAPSGSIPYSALPHPATTA